MEQPHAGVVALEPHDDMPVRPDQEHISFHRPLWQDQTAIGHGIGIVVTRIVVSAHDGLEGVAVQMERVFSRVLVVEHDLDHLVVAQHVRVGVGTVHGRVGGQVARGEGGVEGRDFRTYVGDAAKEGVVLNHRQIPG